MKKKILIGILSTSIVLGGALAVGATNLGLSVVEPKVDKKEMISADQAENIALKRINGVVESVELEKESGKLFYEIDIEKDRIDYGVYVDAYSGEIYSVDQDDDRDDKNNEAVKTTKVDDSKTATVSTSKQSNDDQDDIVKNTSKEESSEIITSGQAVQIAEKATNAKVNSVEKDEDDGQIEYELELNTDKGKVEVEMNAKTGKIIELEQDDEDDDDFYDDEDDDDNDD